MKDLLFSQKMPLLEPYVGIYYENLDNGKQYHLNKAFSTKWGGWETSFGNEALPSIYQDETDFTVTLSECMYCEHVIFNIKSIRDFLNYFSYHCYQMSTETNAPETRGSYSVIRGLTLKYNSDDLVTYGSYDDPPYTEPPTLKRDLDSLPDTVDKAASVFFVHKTTNFLSADFKMLALTDDGIEFFDNVNGFAYITVNVQ
jgi:hypothetical protein